MRRRRWSILAVAASIMPPAAVVAFDDPAGVDATAAAVSLSWILAAAGFDIIGRRLPDTLLALGCVPIAMAVAVHLMTGSASALAVTGRGAALMAVPLLAGHLASPHALGFGDVKAAAVIGAALGPIVSPVLVGAGLLVALLAGAAYGMAARRPTIALGPFLVAGALAALLVDRFAGEGTR